MKIVFIHQNMPGQYKHLAPAFAAEHGNQVVFITRRSDRVLRNVRRITYKPRGEAQKPTHRYLLTTENAVWHGQEVARILLALKRQGFVPDIVVGHPGWGEPLFVKDVLPHTPYLNYCEFYYGAEGQDFGFDPSVPTSIDSRLSLRMQSAPILLALEACDRGVAPTIWQRDRHPAAFHDKIEVIHEGIDVDALRPDPAARFALPDGRTLTRADRVVTYVARNLGPYRGFPSFMRAIPRILDAWPDTTFLIIGGDGNSYGSPPKSGRTWREEMLAEVPVDPARVHFLGYLPYNRFTAALGVSSAHVYLTYPFVLSWSMLEAMAMGCLIVGSDTAPVREVIEDGVNGLLVDFFSPTAIADRIAAVLGEPQAFEKLRAAAHATVVERYALRDCLRRNLDLVRQTAGR